MVAAAQTTSLAAKSLFMPGFSDQSTVLADFDGDGRWDQALTQTKNISVRADLPYRGRFLRLRLQQNKIQGVRELTFFYDLSRNRYLLRSESLVKHGSMGKRAPSILDGDTSPGQVDCQMQNQAGDAKRNATEIHQASVQGLVEKTQLIERSCHALPQLENELVKYLADAQAAKLDRTKEIFQCAADIGYKDQAMGFLAQIGSQLRSTGAPVFTCEEKSKTDLSRVAEFDTATQKITFFKSQLSGPSANLSEVIHHEVMHRSGFSEEQVEIVETCCGTFGKPRQNKAHCNLTKKDHDAHTVAESLDAASGSLVLQQALLSEFAVSGSDGVKELKLRLDDLISASIADNKDGLKSCSETSEPSQRKCEAIVAEILRVSADRTVGSICPQRQHESFCKNTSSNNPRTMDTDEWLNVVRQCPNSQTTDRPAKCQLVDAVLGRKGSYVNKGSGPKEDSLTSSSGPQAPRVVPNELAEVQLAKQDRSPNLVGPLTGAPIRGVPIDLGDPAAARQIAIAQTGQAFRPMEDIAKGARSFVNWFNSAGSGGKSREPAADTESKRDGRDATGHSSSKARFELPKIPLPADAKILGIPLAVDPKLFAANASYNDGAKEKVTSVSADHATGLRKPSNINTPRTAGRNQATASSTASSQRPTSGSTRSIASASSTGGPRSNGSTLSSNTGSRDGKIPPSTSLDSSSSGSDPDSDSNDPAQNTVLDSPNAIVQSLSQNYSEVRSLIEDESKQAQLLRVLQQRQIQVVLPDGRRLPRQAPSARIRYIYSSPNAPPRIERISPSTRKAR